MFSGGIHQRARPGLARFATALLAGAATLALATGCGGSAGATSEASPPASFHAPETYTLDALQRDHPYTCKPDDGRCAIDYLSDLTDTYGPRAALGMVGVIERKHKLAPGIDDHQLAHAIGRATAEEFGIDARAFDLCTTDFNYGCVHGFFEYALGRVATAGDAAVAICDSSSNRTLNSRFSCYHGVGHGVMMAKAYDLKPALATCDSLADYIAEDGCWQGVFMENVNAALKNEARPGVFSRAHPLAPCTRLAAKYAQECYINHAGWLMEVTKLDLAKASRICLGAPRTAVSVCAQSLGLMVTNPTWQASLAPKLEGMANEKVAWKLCLRFPAQLRNDCVVAAVDNIASFDELDVSRSIRFCALVAADYTTACYRQIGVNLSRRVTTREEAQQRCSAVPAEHRDECRSGVSVVAATPPPPPTTTKQTTTPVTTTTQAPPKDAVVVKLTDKGFSPDQITISRGQTITFVNASKDDMWPASNPHPIHTNYEGFDPGRSIPPGGSWSFKFERKGTWGFHNHLDPITIGTITVR